MMSKQVCPFRVWGVHDRGTEYKCVGGVLDGWLCEDEWADVYECEYAKKVRCKKVKNTKPKQLS